MKKPCHLFEGKIASTGYGYWRERDETGTLRQVYAHRRAWELANGRPIPPRWQVDHLCHNEDISCPGGESCLHRRCDEPTHLEAVTQAVNNSRIHWIQEQKAKTHCPAGHAYAGENLRLRANGGRGCRQCDRDSARRSSLTRVRPSRARKAS